MNIYARSALSVFLLLSTLIGVPATHSAEYYIYHDPAGKLVISNSKPPPGSKIIKATKRFPIQQKAKRRWFKTEMRCDQTKTQPHRSHQTRNRLTEATGGTNGLSTYLQCNQRWVSRTDLANSACLVVDLDDEAMAPRSAA
jgi:hypothetical protein